MWYVLNQNNALHNIKSTKKVIYHTIICISIYKRSGMTVLENTGNHHLLTLINKIPMNVKATNANWHRYDVLATSGGQH